MTLIENVVGLVYKKGTRVESGVVHNLEASNVQNNIRKVVATLENLGYSVAVSIIDPTLYGVPQHRLRVWILALWTPFCAFPDFSRIVSMNMDHMKVPMMPLSDFILDVGSEEYKYWLDKEDRC